MCRLACLQQIATAYPQNVPNVSPLRIPAACLTTDRNRGSEGIGLPLAAAAAFSLILCSAGTTVKPQTPPTTRPLAKESTNTASQEAPLDKGISRLSTDMSSAVPHKLCAVGVLPSVVCMYVCALLARAATRKGSSERLCTSLELFARC